jgi:hypothetical protein
MKSGRAQKRRSERVLMRALYSKRVSYSRYERPEAREPDAGILQYSEEGDRRFGARSRL